MARRVAIAIVAVALVAVTVTAGSTGRVVIANVDGPPVLVDIVGFTRASVGCPDTQTVWVPLLRLISRDVVVTDARSGSILRKISVSGDTVVLVRRDLVLYGPPGSSYGPAPVNGCA